MIKKKIFFFGTPDIAVPALQKIASLEEYEVVGVGVMPDKPIGRKQILTPCPVKREAQKLDLPVYEIKNKKDLITLHKSHTFDLGFVIAFGVIFPPEILECQKYINIHFSLLPLYRGASPVQSAILSGDKTSGITFQIIAEKLDSGAVLWQKKHSIEKKKTSELFSFFAEETAHILPEFLASYFTKKISPLPQDESKATYCTKFQKSDGEISPSLQTAQEIYQKFLAFDLWPGIFLSTPKGNIKLTQISLSPQTKSQKIDCAKNTEIFIERAQIAGKKEMSVSEILRGNPQSFILD